MANDADVSGVGWIVRRKRCPLSPGPRASSRRTPTPDRTGSDLPHQSSVATALCRQPFCLPRRASRFFWLRCWTRRTSSGIIIPKSPEGIWRYLTERNRLPSHGAGMRQGQLNGNVVRCGRPFLEMVQVTASWLAGRRFGILIPNDKGARQGGCLLTLRLPRPPYYLNNL